MECGGFDAALALFAVPSTSKSTYTFTRSIRMEAMPHRGLIQSGVSAAALHMADHGSGPGRLLPDRRGVRPRCGVPGDPAQSPRRRRHADLCTGESPRRPGHRDWREEQAVQPVGWVESRRDEAPPFLYCGCRRFRVIYTRRGWGGKLIRRRECRHCGKRMTTWERPIGA